ncbi:hypothetical protein FH609_024380 [Streptomyces sp. 3MP-14]|uniref:RecA family profile 2 domain-containing protein n=1 Tax=Streptomyces mimosae TaxID=2586635 RepID=A0A5N6A0N0_9ACTN|nr:hypothetical protein FH607_022355 [Streptomyces mimosae]KAB8173993.1 hypothetical protein FH609_024380 [Streptomyces sp. 3MP-14]
MIDPDAGRVSKADRKRRPPPDGGRLTTEIRLATEKGYRQRFEAPAFAYPERQPPPGGSAADYLAARRRGVRAFTLWADPDRRTRLADVVTRVANGPKRYARFEVLGPDGASLALIDREPASFARPRRTCWTVRLADGTVAVGRKGRPFWWWVWWLVSPFQALMLLLALLGGDVARPPRRTRWRVGRGVVLDWASGQRVFELEEVAGAWDHRVTAALVALLSSHEGWLGDNWEDGKG